MNGFKKLLLSLGLDAVGVLPTIAGLVGASTGVFAWIVPFAELIDVVWAPVSAYLIMLLYNKRLFSIVSFVEEALPFTDFIPTFTIAWIVERFQRKRVFQACRTRYKDEASVLKCVSNYS